MLPQIVHGAQICARLLSYLFVENKSPRITMVTAPICAIQYIHIYMCLHFYTYVQSRIQRCKTAHTSFRRTDGYEVGDAYDTSNTLFYYHILMTGYKVLLHHPLNHASNHNSCSIQMIWKNIHLHPNPIIIRRKSLSYSRPTQ